MWEVLEALHVMNGKICWEDPDDIYETIVEVFPLQRYLNKVVEVLRDVKIMLNAANSSRLRQYFLKDFTITTVNPIGSFPFPLPKSEDGWQAVVHKWLWGSGVQGCGWGGERSRLTREGVLRVQGLEDL